MPATADCRRVAECSACRADLSGDNLATRIKHIFACRRVHAVQQAVAAVPAAVTTAAAAAPGVSDEPPATEVTAEVAAKAAAAEVETAAAAETAAEAKAETETEAEGTEGEEECWVVGPNDVRAPVQQVMLGPSRCLLTLGLEGDERGLTPLTTLLVRPLPR